LEDDIEQALRQLLYAPGVVATRSAYPAASRRTAPSSRIKPCLSSSHSSFRLVLAPVQQAAFKDDLELGRLLTLTNSVCGELLPVLFGDFLCNSTESQHLNLLDFQTFMHGFTPRAWRRSGFGTFLLMGCWLIAEFYRLLSHAIHTHVLDPALLPQLLRTVRAALFPNNTLPPPRTIPTVSEQLLIRQGCAEAFLSLIPAKIQDIYFGPGIERRVREVEEVLNIFDDSYCNKHLLYGVVELIVIRLIPELAEKGVATLLADRLG
jgi:hypothetical protein